ncbi:MAG TPA: FAD-dependent oxidoreductase [Myxococcaceae bacterium]|nr:FAD-dependent oxidoreductase [Myxococcaceae bacterium]
MLVGSAHAHLVALARFARRPLPGVELHWVTRGEQAVYTGMLPGWVAGELTRADLTVELRPLALAARAALHPEGAVGIEAPSRSVRLAGGELVEADVLSLGIGSGLRGLDFPGVREHASNVRLLAARAEHFQASPGPAVVVGGGLGGVELALCLRAACDRVSLVSETEEIPQGAPPPLVRAVKRALADRGVQPVQGRAVRVTAEEVTLSDGRRLPARTVLWATGPAPHPLLAASGLELGPSGAVRVGPSLGSTSHPDIFAAGDCADLPAPVPKSGVYSVREGPVLAHNLEARLRDAPLRPYRPQGHALALVNFGDGTALLSRGRLVARGRWVRAWKDHLDRGFLDGLRRAAQRTDP